MTDGRIPGHEGVGVIEQVGTGVSEFHVGDRVIISCVTACLKCDFCKRGMYSHYRHGGWILAYTIDGTQAKYVRINNGSRHDPILLMALIHFIDLLLKQYGNTLLSEQAFR